MLSQEPRPSLHGHSLVSTAALGAHWGGLLEQDRLFSSLHAILADASLNTMPADVWESVPTLTWAHLADSVRVAQSAWKDGTKLSTNLATLQTVWLLLGGGTPSPREVHSKNVSVNLARALRVR